MAFRPDKPYGRDSLEGGVVTISIIEDFGGGRRFHVSVSDGKDDPHALVAAVKKECALGSVLSVVIAAGGSRAAWIQALNAIKGYFAGPLAVRDRPADRGGGLMVGNVPSSAGFVKSVLSWFAESNRKIDNVREPNMTTQELAKLQQEQRNQQRTFEILSKLLGEM